MILRDVSRPSLTDVQPRSEERKKMFLSPSPDRPSAAMDGPHHDPSQVRANPNPSFL